MITTSDTYKQAVTKSGRHFDLKIVIDGKTYTSVKGFKYKGGVNASDAITFGDATSAYFECTLFGVPKGTVLKGKQAIPYVGLQTASSVEWIPLGAFHLDKPIRAKEYIKITAYDNFSLCYKGFFSDLAGEQKIVTIINEQCNKLGLEFAGGADDATYNIDNLQGLTVIDAIARLSAYCGKNAIMDRDGKLKFIWYTDTSISITPNAYADPLETLEEDTYINKLECAVSEETTLTVGTGMGIQFSCQGMTQERLNILYNRTRGFTYRAAKINWKIARPDVEAGDIIKVIDKDGTIYNVPIMDVEFNCDGGFYGTVESKGKTEEEQENSYKGPLQTKIDITYSDVIATKKLLADKIIAYEGEFEIVNTNYLNVNKKLTANEAEIGEIKTNYVKSTVFEGELAKLNEAIIGKLDTVEFTAITGKVNLLEVDIEKVNTLIAGGITAGSTQTIVLNAQNTTIANALIKSAMIESVAANKVTAGTIDTSIIHLKSKSGNMDIFDNTISIRDTNRQRVQIGKDASNDYNIYVWDKTGKLMFDATGITADGIQKPIIRNDMVSDNANIAGSKINITSLVTEINNGTTKIESSHVLYDGKSLDVAFNDMTTTVDEKINGIEVGGRNLALQTSTERTSNRNVAYAISNIGFDESDYTVSFYIKSAKAGKALVYVNDDSGQERYHLSFGEIDVTTEYKKIVLTKKSVKYTGAVDKMYVRVYGQASDILLSGKMMMLEKSNKSSDWKPAIEDNIQEIKTVTESVKTLSTQLTAEQGKIGALITSTEQTKQDITKVQGDVTTAKGNITTLQTNYNNVQATVSGLSTTVGQHTSSITNLTTGLNNLRTSGLHMLVNHDTFATANDGECFLGGYDAHGNPADVNGWIMWGNEKITIKKGMWVNPNSDIPANTMVYLVLNESRTDIFNAWYSITEKKWKNMYCKNSPSGNVGISNLGWTDNHIVIGYFVTANSSEGKIINAGLYDPVRSYRDIAASPEITTTIKTVTDKQSTFENTINGISGKVSAVESTVTSIGNRTNALESLNFNNFSRTGKLDGWYNPSNTLTLIDDATYGKVAKSAVSWDVTYYSPYFEVDVNKSYKIGLTIKRLDSVKASVYFGLYFYNDKKELIGCYSDSGSTLNTNFYFWYSATISKDIWVTTEGYLMASSAQRDKLPKGYSSIGASVHPAWMLPNTKYIRIRFLNFYHDANIPATMLFAHPFISEVDTSIASLTTDITTVSSKQSALELTVNQFKTTVSDTYTTKTDFGKSDELNRAIGLMATGKLLYQDPTFKTGANNVSFYNNNADGKVTATRIAKSADCPTTSTHYVEIKSTGAGNPGLGGFVHPITSRANAKFVVKYLIKLPVGYVLATASNNMGNGYVDKFLTPVAGTGKWEEYIRVVTCGTSGTFARGGHVYASGKVPTASVPLIWYLGAIYTYDVTDATDAYEAITALSTEVTQKMDSWTVDIKSTYNKTNLIVNSDFTNNLNGWTNGGGGFRTSMGWGSNSTTGHGVLVEGRKGVEYFLGQNIQLNGTFALGVYYSCDVFVSGYSAGATNPFVAIYMSVEYSDGTVGYHHRLITDVTSSFKRVGFYTVTKKAIKAINAYLYARDFTGKAYFSRPFLTVAERELSPEYWSPSPSEITGNTKVQIDYSGLSVYGGGISVYNNAGTKVLSSDTSGNLSMTGTITANAGSIGGWTITSNNIYTSSSLFEVFINRPTVFGGMGTSGSDVLVVHDKTKGSWPVVISSNGSVHLENANIIGNITGGTITGNTAINVGTDLRVGDNIYLGTNPGTYKIIQFNDTTQITRTTFGSGNYLAMRSDYRVAMLTSRNGVSASIATWIPDGTNTQIDIQAEKISIQTNDGSKGFYINSSGKQMTFSHNKARIDWWYDSENYGGYLTPSREDVTLGKMNALWHRVYARYSEYTPSDIRLKQNIQTYDERFENMFMDLRPVTYEMKDDPSKRQCGMIAQWVKSSMDKFNIKEEEFSVYEYNKENDMYGLVYPQMTSLNTHMIQKAIKQVAQVRNDVSIEITQLKIQHQQELQNLSNKYRDKFFILENRIKQLESQLN